MLRYSWWILGILYGIMFNQNWKPTKKVPKVCHSFISFFALTCNLSTNKYSPAQCQRNPHSLTFHRVEVVIDKETKIFYTQPTLKLLDCGIERMHLNILINFDVLKKINAGVNWTKSSICPPFWFQHFLLRSLSYVDWEQEAFTCLGLVTDNWKQISLFFTLLVRNFFSAKVHSDHFILHIVYTFALAVPRQY